METHNKIIKACAANIFIHWQRPLLNSIQIVYEEIGDVSNTYFRDISWLFPEENDDVLVSSPSCTFIFVIS